MAHAALNNPTPKARIVFFISVPQNMQCCWSDRIIPDGFMHVVRVKGERRMTKQHDGVCKDFSCRGTVFWRALQNRCVFAALPAIPINDVTSQLPPKDLICDALLAQSARRVGIHWHIANWFKGR